MATFNWGKDTITLDFGTVRVDLDIDNEVIEAIQKSGTYIKQNTEKMNELSGESVGVIMNAIDMIIGEGGSAAVFEGHKANVLTAMRVWTYICTEYATRFKEHFERMQKSALADFPSTPDFSTPINKQAVKWHR